jgi:hypothetical protein
MKPVLLILTALALAPLARIAMHGANMISAL